MSAATKAMLTNKDVIAVDQDPLGQQGASWRRAGTNLEMWSKEDVGNQHARRRALQSRHVERLDHREMEQSACRRAAATVRDLWEGEDLGPSTDRYTASAVAGHDVVMLKIVSTP